MSIREIHFLIPPPDDGGKSPDRIFGCNYAFFFQHNIFILYPATLLKKAGYNVRVIDCTIYSRSHAERGNELIDSALKDKADAYVFYSVFLSREIDLQTANIIESRLSRDIPIIFMGSDPTYCPEKYLLSPNRFVIRGEPEYSLLDLINNLNNPPIPPLAKGGKGGFNVEGVSWYANEKVIHNPYRRYIEDLDSLPFPDRTLLPTSLKRSRQETFKIFQGVYTSWNISRVFGLPFSLKKVSEKEASKKTLRYSGEAHFLKYLKSFWPTFFQKGRYFNAKFKRLPSTTILTSRGCAFKCYYCVPNSLSFARELEWKRAHGGSKPPVTKRDVNNIIEEFKDIASSGYKSVFILDDQFVWGKARTLEILEGIKDLNLEISLLARPDMLTDKELVSKMAEAGVRHVDLGVESFNENILRDIRKDLDVSTIEKSIMLLKEANIKPEINIMLGASPLETEETIKDTLEKVKRYDVEIVHAKICAPFPGTEFHDIAKKSGWMITKEYVPIDTACDSLISYPHLSREKLIELLKTFYREHYFNPRYLIKHLVALKSFSELKNKARTAVNMWKNIIAHR